MSCDTPYFVALRDGKEVPVPCGRCPICKRNRVNQWVFRLLQEDRASFHSHFVTLTYDTRHVPIHSSGFMTLDKTDLQKFFKRLRKKQNSKIRYYAVGEYGSENMRPHYHLIMFDVEEVDDIHKAWQLGEVVVGTVTAASIAYTAKYIHKPGKIPAWEGDPRQQEFSLMSKGLGKNYLTPEMVKWHKDDLTRQYVRTPEGVKVPIPRYYKEKIFGVKEKHDIRAGIEKIDNTLLTKIQRIAEFKAKKAEQLKDKQIQIIYPGYDLDKWKHDEKVGRYEQFYKNQKVRK